VRPDGDALGSEVGMAGLLGQLGKDAKVVNVSATPPRYDFLDPEGTRFLRFGHAGARPEDMADRQVIVILDLSSWSQLCEMTDFVRGFAGPRVVIDHHLIEDDLGAIMLKDPEAEATGTLVLRVTRALGVKPTREMAVGLLTAIAMDTGWFRHPTTSAETLRDAAELLESGADVNALFRLLFERNTLGRLRLFGCALSTLKVDVDGRVAYMVATRDDFARTGAIPPDTEDLVDYTVTLCGVEVGLLFIEQPRGGIKVSMRSRGDFDVAAIARQFGGGGHRAAAGANLTDPLSDCLPRVVEAIRRGMAARAAIVSESG
jgi:phosphoesterase RecJ-like protein